MPVLTTLGSLDLRDDEGQSVASVLSQPRLTALLVYLTAARPGLFHRRDTLLELIWPEATESRARHRLNQMLYGLRKALGDPVLVSRGKDEVGVPEGRLRCDVTQFRSAIVERRWEDALDRYRGAFLEGFYVSQAPGLERWIEEERAQLRRMALDAALKVSQEARNERDLARAVRCARRALEIEPHSEPALRMLMGALYERGDRTQALGAFEEFRRRLESEFELEPSPPTTELVATIRRQAEPNRSGAVAFTSPATHDTWGSTPVGPVPISHAVATRHGRNLGLTLAGLGVALLGFAAVAWAVLSSPSAPSFLDGEGVPPVVAVVPIVVSGSVPPELGDLGRAVTTELTARLGQITGLILVPSNAVEPFLRQGVGSLEIGRSLKADAVVAGSLEWGPAGTQSRAEVIDVHSGEVLWRVEHAHAPKELLSAQQDITLGVAAALNVTRSAPPVRPVPASSEEELFAWAYAEQARSLLDSAPRNANGYGRPDLDRVEELLGKAIELAPGYGPTYAVLSRFYRARFDSEGRSRPQLVDSAVVAAERAVSLDPDHHLSHVALVRALARVMTIAPERYSPDDNRRRLEAAVRALQLNPNDPTVVAMAAGNLGSPGRRLVWGERGALLRRNFRRAYYERAHWFWMLGAYEASTRAYEQVRALDPDWMVPKLGIPQVDLSRGRLVEARAATDALRAALPQHLGAIGLSVIVDIAEGRFETTEADLETLLDGGMEVANEANFHTRTALAYVYLQTGRESEGRRLLETLVMRKEGILERGAGFVAHYDMARLQAMLGNTDEALRWLEVAIDRGWHFYYTWMGPEDPMLSNIANDPRFMRIMEDLRASLDAELVWVEEMMALPETERLERMIADAERQLEEKWREAAERAKTDPDWVRSAR